MNGVVGPGFAVGSRFKGSIRNGLNSVVAPGSAAGSRFKGSIRDGLNGVTGPGFAVGSGGAGGKLAFQETVINVGRNWGVAGEAASLGVGG